MCYSVDIIYLTVNIFLEQLQLSYTPITLFIYLFIYFVTLSLIIISIQFSHVK
jgi:hypothetical protein